MFKFFRIPAISAILILSAHQGLAFDPRTDPAEQLNWTLLCHRYRPTCEVRNQWLSLSWQNGVLTVNINVEGHSRAAIIRHRLATPADPLRYGQISARLLARMDQDDAWLVLETPTDVLASVRTTGVSAAVADLSRATTARGQPISEIDPTVAPPNHLAAMAARHELDKLGRERIIPHTRPQSEFAIRAQNGQPFRDPGGAAALR